MTFHSRAQFAPPLQAYCERLSAEFDQIPADRRAQLGRIAAYIRSRRAAGQPARLHFICTHNSRRSQLGQVWAHTAALYMGIVGVESFSGGTEETACHPNTVAALRRAGFEVRQEGGSLRNPRYQVLTGQVLTGQVLTGDRETAPSLWLWSKVYQDPANPSEGFCAIPVCSSADAACPLVPGADLRVYHGYEDPKKADGSPQEAQAYDDACRLIAREMFYMCSLLR